MGLLSDRMIRQLAFDQGMIEPFSEKLVSKGVISFGLGSYGYDVRIGSRFKIFDSWLDMHRGMIDPKKQDWHKCFTSWGAEEENKIMDDRDGTGSYVIIPANSFALGESVEKFNIPSDVLCVCLGKSTYARCGILVNVTPGEPGWIGHWTIEISNTTPLPAKVYVNEGIMQVLFFRGDNRCEITYSDRHGKYQNQTGLTMPKVINGG